MAFYDVIDAAQHGYRQAWAERAYLMRLALVPIAVKFICAVTVLSLDLTTNHVRQALIFLPDYFTEGWMLAHVVRFAFLGQRWPFRPTGDNAADELVLRDRFRGVMAGTLVYVLSRFLATGVLHFVQAAERQATAAAEAQAADAGMFFGMIVMMLVFLWCFRLMWLFIPAALNYPALPFLRVLGRGLMPSLYLIGTWLVCFAPMVFVLKLAVTFVASIVGISAGLEFVVTFAQAVVETITTIITTLAIGWGVAQMMAPPKEKKPPGKGKPRR